MTDGEESSVVLSGVEAFYEHTREYFDSAQCDKYDF